MPEVMYAPPSAAVADIDADETNIRVEFDLKFRDYYVYCCVHQFTHWTLQILNSAFACVFFYGHARGGNPGFGLFGGLVLYVGIWMFQFAYNAVALFSKKNRSILSHHVMEIREDGLHDETPYYRHLHFWNSVVKVVSRPGYVAIYTTAHNANLVPARAFANASHRSAFMATARRWMELARPG